MLATLWLISASVPTLWAQVLIGCSYKSLCQRALLSGNDVVLQCDHLQALWYFSSILGENLFLVDSLPHIKRLPGGSLKLANPQPSQAGLYRCEDNDNTLVVEYEIDFQDVTTLHVTHKGLGQKPLENETLRLGGEALIFTLWEPWQDCNRCGEPGERKRLGYCYVEEPPEKPIPCGLYLREEKVQSSRLRPELQVDACLEPCDPAKETNQPYFIFDINQLGKLTTNMWLTCPMASVYSCPSGRKCQKALLSGSNVILQCNTDGAQWHFFFRQNRNGWIVSKASDFNVETMPEGHLLIRNPLPIHTGLYACETKNGTQVVQYEIDFQDASILYVTHKDLGQKPLENETLSPCRKETIFTRWEPWQDCNLCEMLGERKRLGYCYVQEPLEEAIPCGLFLKEVTLWSSRLRPEMQVEVCSVLCKTESELHAQYITFDNFKLDELESLWLTCPFASVYSPIVWEADNVPVTWQNQLSGQQFNTFLDPSTGGKQLQILQPATYKCFVNQELIAHFEPEKSEKTLSDPEPQRSQHYGGDQDREDQAPLRQADSVLKGLKLMLLVGTVLALVWLLFKSFHPAHGKRNNSLLLVK